jgi:hypothetical protein
MSDIEDRLDRIERKLDALMNALKASNNGASARANVTANAGASGGGDNLDVDIDGPRGDPEVRFMPKRWTGADYKGQKFSSCEPEFLDMLAETFEWFAQRDDDSGAVDKNGAPKSKWSRLDAGRARAWAARLRGDSPAASKPRAKGFGGGGGNNRPAPAPAPTNGHSMGGFGSAQDDDIPF